MKYLPKFMTFNSIFKVRIEPRSFVVDSAKMKPAGGIKTVGGTKTAGAKNAQKKAPLPKEKRF